MKNDNLESKKGEEKHEKWPCDVKKWGGMRCAGMKKWKNEGMKCASLEWKNEKMKEWKCLPIQDSIFVIVYKSTRKVLDG